MSNFISSDNAPATLLDNIILCKKQYFSNETMKTFHRCRYNLYKNDDMDIIAADKKSKLVSAVLDYTKYACKILRDTLKQLEKNGK